MYKYPYLDTYILYFFKQISVNNVNIQNIDIRILFCMFKYLSIL